jgi:hypothetical protein
VLSDRVGSYSGLLLEAEAGEGLPGSSLHGSSVGRGDEGGGLRGSYARPRGRMVPRCQLV